MDKRKADPARYRISSIITPSLRNMLEINSKRLHNFGRLLDKVHVA